MTRQRALLLLAALLFVASRLGAWAMTRNGVPFGDQYNYLVIAQNIAAGRGMVIDDPQILDNLRAWYPPLYPFLLGLIGKVAPLTPGLLSLLNAATDLATAAVTIALARRLGVPRAGWPAALALLFWPVAVAFSAMAYKEGLTLLLMLSMLLALLIGCERSSPRWWALSGALAGLLILCNPALAAFVAFMFIALRGRFASRRAWWTGTCLAAGVCCIVMAPWWVRNWMVFHRFVPLTTTASFAWWVPTQDVGVSQWAPPPMWARHGSELDLSAAMTAETLRIIRADPGAYLWRIAGQWPASYLMPSVSLLQLQLLDPAGFQRWIDPIKFVPMWLDAGISAAAFSLAALRPRTDLARLIAAGIVQILLVGIWYQFGERQRYFLLPFLLLMIASAWRNQARAPVLKGA